MCKNMQNMQETTWETYPASDRCRHVGQPQKPSPPSTTIFFAAPADIDIPSSLAHGAAAAAAAEDWGRAPANLDHEARDVPDPTDVRV